MWDNLNSTLCSLPTMRFMPKTLKAANPGGTPQTRAVCGASSCMTTRASEGLCNVIKAVAEGHPLAGEECSSTEDMLNRTERAEKVVNAEGEKAVMLSIDAIALYPNLDI